MGRLRHLAGTVAILAALAAPAAAPAAPAVDLVAPQTVARDCAGGELPAGIPGADARRWVAPASGVLTVALNGGTSPDWDLAVFVAGSEEPSVSTSSTSIERAQVWVDAGDEVRAQGCRVEGDDPRVPVSFELYEADRPEPSGERISLESVSVSGPADIERLQDLGFDVTHDVGPTTASVVLYSSAGRRRLAAAGFDSEPLIGDLVARDAADRRAEERVATSRAAGEFPSGRTTYRQYADYTTELKALAAANPSLVRSLVIGTTFEGRPIEGVEIASAVNRSDDGRPVYLNFGAHHAREWPSAELPMEFALDLVESYNAADPRVRSLLDRVRVIIVPVVNVDGFIASRSSGEPTPIDDDEIATLIQSATGSGAYRRKNCRPTSSAPGTPCALATTSGVDLNRNYGAYWGGPGSSPDISSQSYRGTGPFSEPESEAVHRFTSKLHPTVFISNHTFTDTGLWLRQPGFNASFLPQDSIGALTEDEAAMKSLGDAMGGATGWISERGYESLGNITGATEDWNYFAQGTYGYTPEIRGTNFHANYSAMVVEEYVGDQSHVNLGAREAFLIAGERAANPADHGIIAGAAPPGATLRLRKEFDTPTCRADPCDGTGEPFRDVLSTVLQVPASGRYEWHVNPSSRPAAPGVPAEELWTMTCDSGTGVEPARTPVGIGRGERVNVDFSGGACARPGPPPVVTTEPGGTKQPKPLSCAGKPATLIGSSRADAGKRAIRGTGRRDVIIGLTGTDRILSRRGRDLICGGKGNDRVNSGPGGDNVIGGPGRDRLQGGLGADRISGSAGRDVLRGGPGPDRFRGGKGRDSCRVRRGDRARSCS